MIRVFYLERVAIDESRILYPICYGVLLEIGIHDKRTVGIKVQSAKLWQRVTSIAEEELQSVRFLSLVFDHVSVSEGNCECPQHHIVGIEMCESTAYDGVDTQ